MSLYFRRSKAFGPFRLTFSKRGLSTSVGGMGLRLTAGPNGMRATASKGGLRYTHRLDTPARHTTRRPTPAAVRTRQMPAQAGRAGAAPSAGWYDDPVHHFGQRFWSGTAWTDRVRQVGAETTDHV